MSLISQSLLPNQFSSEKDSTTESGTDKRDEQAQYPDLGEARQEHEIEHETTLRTLQEHEEVLGEVIDTLSSARRRLQEATRKYEERLHGTNSPESRAN